jgi:hypothetical protein
MEEKSTAVETDEGAEEEQRPSLRWLLERGAAGEAAGPLEHRQRVVPPTDGDVAGEAEVGNRERSGRDVAAGVAGLSGRDAEGEEAVLLKCSAERGEEGVAEEVRQVQQLA